MHRRMWSGSRRRGAAVLVALAAGGCVRPEGPSVVAASELLVFGSSGVLAVMSPDGKGRRDLTQAVPGASARDPAWSPDGKRIVYVYSPPLPAVRGPGGLLPLPVSDVYVMNADGSEPRVLARNAGPGTGWESPVWAPDGRSLYATFYEMVVESTTSQEQRVEVARLPLDRAQNLVGGEDMAKARQTLIADGMFPTVSPDGKRLAYLHLPPRRNAEHTELRLAHVDGTSTMVLATPRILEGISAPRFSPDGTQIAFSAVAPLPDTSAADSPPTPPRSRATQSGPTSTADRVIAETKKLLMAATAPLLPRIARAHGKPMDLFRIGVEGGTPVRITQFGEDSPAGAWSPDGTRLAVLAGGGLYVMNASGTERARIDSKGGHGTLDWRR